jgi:hypothetical protein
LAPEGMGFLCQTPVTPWVPPFFVGRFWRIKI